MATLEVHDGQGRVQFVELTRDHPVLFGTSATCDVVLEGAGIRPVHGRVRWRRKRFKVEASPDAEYVLVNGQKMTSSTIHQGDEIAVGACRMFLLKVAEEEDAGPGARRRGEEGRTQVLAAPVVPLDPNAGVAGPGRHGRPPTHLHMGPTSESLLERDDWLDALKEDSPGGKRRPLLDDDAKPPEVLRRSTMRPTAPAPAPAQAPAPAPKPKLAVPPALRLWWARLRSYSQKNAPGRERIISSPLVLGLVAALAILVAMGFWLKAIIAATVASQTFKTAMEDFNNGDYRNSIRKFDAFLQANPTDERADKARVMRAFADVRQYIALDGSTWSSALEAARAMVEQVGELPEFRDEQVDLAELLIRIGEGLADRARHSADAKSLAEAESVVPLHAQVAKESAPAFLARSRLPAKLSEARAAVQKAQIYARALDAMDSALKEGSASRVYQARDDLVGQYSDLARDRALVKRMTSANELVRKAVSVDLTRRPAATTPSPDPLGPPTSVVFRSRQDAPAKALSPAAIVYALADGLAYAFDGTSGAPLWHVYLGLAAPFGPVAIPGETTAVVCDARTNELVELDAQTGALKWRLALGEAVRDPPLVLGNQLAQVLPSGKLLLMSLRSGELEATVNLGRPLARTPVNDELGQHLYVLGRQDCLFVLARDPLACAAVEYLGHADGSIPCAPARLARFLIIPENDSLSESIWHVLVLEQDGARLRTVQEVPISGWTWQTPASSGSIVWAIGDKGGYQAFSVGDYTTKEPFHSVARLTADATSTGPAFALARSERELWIASGHPGLIALDPERESITPKSSFAPPGPALQPIQAAGNIVVATFRDRPTGGVALLGLDAETGALAWKTIVGAPWPTPLGVSADSKALLTIGRDGRELAISTDQIDRGGFVVVGLPKPGDFTLPSGTRLSLETGGKAGSAVIPGRHAETIWVQDAARSEGWRRVPLPAPLAADPLFWSGGIFVPGRDARAYLVDPVTGQSKAEPFVPKFDRDRQGDWLAPARMDRESLVLADQVGRVRRIALRTTPVPRLSAEAERTLDQRIIADPAATTDAVFVATADHRIRALAARDLSPVGSWPLGAPLSGHPVGFGDIAFVMDRAGGVLAFGRDGKKLWAISLGAQVAAAPLVEAQTIGFLTRDGTLHIRSRADGSRIDDKRLSILPAGGVWSFANRVVVAAGRGTIRLVAQQPPAKGGQ
ncbi:MAG: PQQ-binding-like beta-propeller repeat protein [Isosphaeraceae bacterium]